MNYIIIFTTLFTLRVDFGVKFRDQIPCGIVFFEIIFFAQTLFYERYCTAWRVDSSIKDLWNMCSYFELNKDFLSGRVQRVIVNISTSKWAKVLSCIPQGNMLGPLLFVIFFNDICDSIKSSSYLFVDDAILFRVIKSEEDIDILHDDSNKIIEWSDNWLLRLNKEKCKQLSINGLSNTKYYINSANGEYEIGRVEIKKDICVTFDK